MDCFLSIGDKLYSVKSSDASVLKKSIVPSFKEIFNNEKIGKVLTEIEFDNKDIKILAIDKLLSVIFSAIPEKNTPMNEPHLVILKNIKNGKVYGHYILQDGIITQWPLEEVNIKRFYYKISENENLKNYCKYVGYNCFGNNETETLQRLFGIMECEKISLVESLLEQPKKVRPPVSIIQKVESFVKHVLQKNISVITNNMLNEHGFIEDDKLNDEMIILFKIKIREVHPDWELFFQPTTNNYILKLSEKSCI